MSNNYSIIPIKVNFDEYNQAYEIFFAIKDNETQQNVYSESVILHLKFIPENTMPSEIIQIAYDKIKDKLINKINEINMFKEIIGKPLN